MSEVPARPPQPGRAESPVDTTPEPVEVGEKELQIDALLAEQAAATARPISPASLTPGESKSTPGVFAANVVASAASPLPDQATALLARLAEMVDPASLELALIEARR